MAQRRHESAPHRSGRPFQRAAGPVFTARGARGKKRAAVREGTIDRRRRAAQRIVVRRIATSDFVDILFLGLTGGVAWRALIRRDAEGKADRVRRLFGCIAPPFLSVGAVWLEIPCFRRLPHGAAYCW